MLRDKTTWVIILTLQMAMLQNKAAGGLYQIVSGTYSECCGIAGESRSPLPNEKQAFVQFTIDPQSNLASMTFLGDDTTTVFSKMPCPPGDPINFSFGFGFATSEGFVFHVDPGPPPTHEFWNFTVTNSPNTLRINGLVGIDSANCADVPTRFGYSNVVAVLMPKLSIRVSEVEVCWNAASNQTYQAQFRSTLTTNTWTNLGAPINGDGSTNSFTDKVLPGQPRRFYRILATP